MEELGNKAMEMSRRSDKERQKRRLKKTRGGLLVEKMLQIPCKRDEKKSTSKRRAMKF